MQQHGKLFFNLLLVVVVTIQNRSGNIFTSFVIVDKINMEVCENKTLVV